MRQDQDIGQPERRDGLVDALFGRLSPWSEIRRCGDRTAADANMGQVRSRPGFDDLRQAAFRESRQKVVRAAAADDYRFRPTERAAGSLVRTSASSSDTTKPKRRN